jgi:hypothetical protein
VRILPGLTASPATATIKKGTYPVSTRILPKAGPVFTPLKTSAIPVGNAILTGPYISTQERATAAKNVLTSVTQQPAVGSLVWPKPLPVQKPVVSTVKPVQPVAPPVVTTPTTKFVIPPRAQPVGALTPQEQTARYGINSGWVSAMNDKLYQAGLGNRTATRGATTPIVPVAETRGQSNLYAPSVPEQPQTFVEAVDSFNNAVAKGIMGANAPVTGGIAGNRWVDLAASIAGVGVGIYAAMTALQALKFGIDVLMAPGTPRDTVTTTLFPSFDTPKEAYVYVHNLEMADPAAAEKFKSDLVTVLAQTMAKGTGEDSLAPDIQRAAGMMYDHLVSNGEAGSFASSAQEITKATTAASDLIAAVHNPQASLSTVQEAAIKLTNTDILRQLSPIATLQELPVAPSPAVERLAVPVGQPITTAQTVAPVPARTAIPAQATAPISRILPHAAEAPAVSSPVATISAEQPSVATPTPVAAPVRAPTAVVPLEQPTMVTTVQKLTDTVDRLAAKVDELTGKRVVPSPIVEYGYDMDTGTVNALDINGNHIGNPVKVKSVQEAQELTAKLNAGLRGKVPLMTTQEIVDAIVSGKGAVTAEDFSRFATENPNGLVQPNGELVKVVLSPEGPRVVKVVGPDGNLTLPMAKAPTRQVGPAVGVPQAEVTPTATQAPTAPVVAPAAVTPPVPTEPAQVTQGRESLIGYHELVRVGGPDWELVAFDKDGAPLWTDRHHPIADRTRVKLWEDATWVKEQLALKNRTPEQVAREEAQRGKDNKKAAAIISTAFSAAVTPAETPTHRQVIVQHLAERIASGKSVSAAVRADYPELQAIAPPVAVEKGEARWLDKDGFAKAMPTPQELDSYIVKRYILNDDFFKDVLGSTKEAAAARARGEPYKEHLVTKNPQMARLMHKAPAKAARVGVGLTSAQGQKALGPDELYPELTRIGLVFPPTLDQQNPIDHMVEVMYEGTAPGAGNATKDINGQELFARGQPIFTSAANKRAAEVGGPLTVANQRTAAALQGRANEGIFAGEVVGLPFNIAAEKGANVSGTNIGANVPAPTGYVAGVPIQAGTTARTIAAENVQKAALAVKDYVSTLATHPGMKETPYHAQLQDRMNQLGVPAGLFTPTQILAMYQASKGPSQLWNLTNRVLMRLNAYNTAQGLLADALNDIPSSVLTKEQKRTLQDATLDNADFMRSLDFIDRELTKAQVTADLREKFDTMLAAEKEKAAIRLARVSQKAADKLKASEWDAAEKDKALKDKAARVKAVSQIDRMLAAVAKNVQTSHTIKLDYVDAIHSIMNGLVKGNKLMANAAANMTTEQVQYLAAAIKTQIAVGRIAYMADRAAREEVIANAVARVLPNLTPMAGYQTKFLDPATYTAIVSRYGRFRNAAAKAGMGITPAETIFKMLGLREMYMDNLGGLTDARQTSDAWRKERLEKAQELGIATDLQQRRIGIWLINQTPGGRNHLLMGNKLTEQDIDTITLTPQEIQYAEFMRAHFDKEFPTLRDYFRDFYNIEVNPVDAYTSLFNSSEFQTDYERAMKDLTFQGAVSGQRKTPKVSMAIKRTGGDNPVELNIFRIGDSYDDTLAYALHLGPRLLKWWGVTMNDDVASRLGDLGNLYVRKQLVNLTYRGGPGGRTAASGVDVSRDWLRRNLSRAQILFRPTSAAIHLIQIVNVAGVTGPNYAIKAAALLVSDPRYAKWVTENFPLLRDSMKNYFEILGLPDDKLAKVGGAMFKWCHNAARVTGAIGNYMWLCEQNEVPLDWEQPNKELLTEAMVLVNKEFGAEDIVSAPAALETGFGIRDDKSLARMLVQFQQDVLAKFDLLKTQLGDGWKEGDPRKVARGLFWIFLVGVALIAGIRYGYRKLISAVTGKKSAATDTYWAELLRDLGENVPWGNSLQAMFQYGDVPVPVLSTLLDTPKQFANFFAYQSGYAKLRAAVRAGTDVGSIIGIPGIGTIGQIVSGFIPTGTGPTLGGAQVPKPTKPAGTKPSKP